MGGWYYVIHYLLVLWTHLEKSLHARLITILWLCVWGRRHKHRCGEGGELDEAIAGQLEEQPASLLACLLGQQ